MKPNLPLRILVPILLVAAAVAVWAAVYPGWAAVAFLTLVLVTLAGGAAVYFAGLSLPGVPGASSILVKGYGRFLLVWVFSTAVLWAFCAPDLYFRDAGELSGAAAGLGVPHPTGFPLLCMLGKLGSLMPVGNVFFRLNLLSGLAAGGVAAFVWLFVDSVVRRGPSDSGAMWWAGPVVLLGSATAWLHATTPEIYSLAALGLAATVFVALEGARRGDARWLMASSALCGVGIGGHVTWPLYGAPTVIFAVVWFAVSGGGGPRLRALVRVGFLCLFAALVGAFVVLYLPAAASRDPLMNWGDPSTLTGTIAHLTGQRIRDSFGSRIGGGNFAVLLANAQMAWRTFFESMAPVLPFVAVGAIAVVARRSLLGISALCLAIADFGFAILINPMGIRDLQVLLTATWASAVLAGVGVSELIRFGGKRAGRAGAVCVAGLATLLVLFQWVSSPADRDMGNLYGPRVISDRILDDAAYGSVVLTSSDDMSSILMARTVVEDARPDMVFLVKQHLSDTRYVTRRLDPFRLRDPGVGRAAVIDAIVRRPFESGGESAAEAVSRAVDLFGGQGPVLFEPGENMADIGVRGRLSPGFPLWSVDVANPQPDAGAQAWMSAIRGRHLVDRWGRAYLAEWARLYGTAEAMKGSDGAAIAVLQSALALDPDDFRSAHNLGVLLADVGDIDESLKLLTSAVSIDPSYVRGWESLAKAAARAGLEGLATDAAARAADLSAGNGH